MQEYKVKGMSCAVCVAHVEKAVRSVEGVEQVDVSLLTNSMKVQGSASPKDVVSAVKKAGYGAKPMAAAGGGQGQASEDALADSETPRMVRRLIASVIVLIPLMYVSMGHMMWNWPLPAFLAGNHVAVGVYELVLAAVVMVINKKFFVSGFSSAIHGAPSMDTLVAMGSGASFIYSTYALYAMAAAVASGGTGAEYMDELYFESAAMILTLITVGKTLEAYSKGRTTDALKSLMKLAPKTACVERESGEVIIPVEQVAIGDIFLVRPGEAIPVDGVVLEGSSAVDESALTGESIPVDKEEGSSVSAGTINASGFLRCQATRVGADTTISQIIQMVSEAASSKAPIAKVADRVSGVFVPSVLVVAVITFIIWNMVGQTFGFALSRAICVLVISCPCALGLATPVAIMVGNGHGAKNGILFKTAVSLEECGKVDIVALDKTGTITTGCPNVTDLLPAEGVSGDELLATAYGLEQRSEHPLARAVNDYAKACGCKAAQVEGFEAMPGNGLRGQVESEACCGGSLRYMETVVQLPEALVQQAGELAAQGKTPLVFAKGECVLGIIAVADVVKAEAPDAVAQLKGMGISVVMLTGDNAATAAAIAAEAGVDAVIAEVLPQDKEAVITSLQSLGRVAMVGDGINDAPALTRANMGIAIGAGTDVAIDAADVVLVKSQLSDVPAAIRLSRHVLTNIHENLFWAFIYNVIGIPLAAGAWYYLLGWKLNPMFGAAAMSLSSFCVVSNALRLNLVKVASSARDKKRPHSFSEEDFAKVVASHS